MTSEEDRSDLVALNAAVAGATVEALEWGGPYHGGGERSPRTLRIGLRARDGRRWSLDVPCELTEAVAAGIDETRGTWPTGTTALTWEPFDPGLQFDVALYLAAGERWDPEVEDDPLAEAVAPLWAGTAAAPVAGVLERIAGLRTQLESVEAGVRMALADLEDLG